jgi:cytidylate kinase
MMRAKPIVAIDGPTGAGKSTVARKLARALGFTYLNTGAMYRAVAIAAHDAGISPDDANVEARLKPVLDAIRIRFEGERIFLNDKDVSSSITQPEISERASQFSALGSVRERMVDLQRAAGAAGGIVMEGRDVGTVIFPDAELKFFLSADVAVRARRRFEELKANGATTSLNEVLERLIDRDRRDSARELAPLKQADDAIAIDATKFSADDVVAAIKKKIDAIINGGKDLKRA